ncbi:CPBP family intramembrane metalloprotease [Flavihumibacter rivuli]|uniref:CPBP family intramembrane glutamic endopeptidase n=1 Tax=Flavihumibacter rivuli TaxID=2838156 RepID=UPI001BDF1A48|nr:type II CAAX endopeptidase family protein [Flavihumibacter rivuli]ULQ55243.1 CPBP family intramembrane metalloprotease [Flavihumibacter rivuli]
MHNSGKYRMFFRNLGWIAIFFLVLAAFTFPVIFISQYNKWQVHPFIQALIVVAVTLVCQLLRKQPFSEVIGTIDQAWFKDVLVGLFYGAILMLLPALYLFLFGYVSWELVNVQPDDILSATVMFTILAIAEEFLFRGFVFQRLMAMIGIWGAQILMGGYFLLIHMNNPGMTGNVKLLASVNIFLASIMFGLAYIKTKKLAMPIAIHFMANWTQGVLLGFGVSGNTGVKLLNPVFGNTPVFLTGGNFGLEASLPGLIAVILITIVLFRWKPRNM